MISGSFKALHVINFIRQGRNIIIKPGGIAQIALGERENLADGAGSFFNAPHGFGYEVFDNWEVSDISSPYIFH